MSFAVGLSPALAIPLQSVAPLDQIRGPPAPVLSEVQVEMARSGLSRRD